MAQDDFTLGVEEEFLVVDATDGGLRPDGPALLPAARDRLGKDVHLELHPTQLETNSPVARTLAEVRTAVTGLRQGLAATLAGAGCRLAASGTHPFCSWAEDPVVNPDYEIVEREYQQLAREQVICGGHVHVGVGDPELAIAIVNRVRPWLAPIVALAANSPFWGGRDTGYASYRTELWRRWPTAGTPASFAGRADYEAVVDALFATGAIDDHARIYWDVRPSAKFPTVEFRVADVGMTVDDAVMAAGLVRAVAVTAARDERQGAPPVAVRPELLRAATWRAARYGINGELVDVPARRALPARTLITALLERLRPALEDFGDWDEVNGLVNDRLSGGTAADRQRAVFAATGDHRAVLRSIVEATTPGAAW
ncbi:MAG TPA: glutamate--cysteine ligase [Acidimicrobiia bacterium]|nr:glutamate--cysteine ligase [Acidimicrobiia bacterium]